jgi:glutathione peroxidase
MSSPLYQMSYITSDGQNLDPSAWRGKVVLVVNTATGCGFASQFNELQALYEQYSARGLVIIGMPCDQFMGQEPVENTDMQATCQLRFGVTFPLLQKGKVNGPNAHPMFQWLKTALPGTFGPRILWNFTKFLIDAQGTPVKRLGPKTNPNTLIPLIESLLLKR